LIVTERRQRLVSRADPNRLAQGPFQTRLVFRRTAGVLSETFSFEACATVAPALRPSSAAISAGRSFPAKLLSLALSASVHDRKLELGICVVLLQNTASNQSSKLGKIGKVPRPRQCSRGLWNEKSQRGQLSTLNYRDLRRRSGGVSVGNMPLPISGKVYGLAALHRQRRYATHLIAIRDAA
jgi:hypothetical protein